VQRFFLYSLRMPSLTEMPAALTERRNAVAVWKPYGARRRTGCRAASGNRCSALRRNCAQAGQR
jgi:hypothetical protein